MTLDELSIFLLLFADDAVLMSESKDGLQLSLRKLEYYCIKWNLHVNTDKTKIVIFRKGGIVNRNYRWYYEGKEIEIVNCFNYLGVVLSSGGSFVKACKTLCDKALKAMVHLFSITMNIEVPIKLMLDLFDTYVQSILNYGCEIWGFIKADNIEIVHKKFCKRILGVKTATNNLLVYAELGRFPLYIHRYIRIIKYWLNLYNKKSGNCLLQAVLRNQRQDTLHEVKNWSFNVKHLLESSGFAHVWNYPESVNVDIFVPLFHMRLKDLYICDWRIGLECKSSLLLYREMKTIFELSDYLMSISNVKYRNIISKLRLSAHNLAIERGRHQNVERRLRKCIYCDVNEIEDEFHFVIVCPKYTYLRNKYINKYYTNRPSMLKFVQLLNSTNVKTLNNLAIFCIKAFKVRGM